MNYDKIDTLLVVAGCRFEFLHGKDYEDFSPYKFAELIIKECVTVVRNGDYTNTADPGFAASCDMMEHFNITLWS